MSASEQPPGLAGTLRALEVALHQPQIRRDREALAALLHPCFREHGRSGASYTREQILAELPEEAQALTTWSQDFHAELLAPGCALLTYRSAQVNAEGQLERHANWASIWQLTDGRWLLRFHQGTPTSSLPPTSEPQA